MSGMDQRRFQELGAKASGPGLSAEEAAELGHLWAEKEGKTYGLATGPPPRRKRQRGETRFRWRRTRDQDKEFLSR